MITELEFKSLAQDGYNRIPLMLEAFADLETPLSLYLKLAHTRNGGQYSFLLESVVGGERFARYSMIGLGKGVYFEYQEDSAPSEDGTQRTSAEDWDRWVRSGAWRTPGI